MTGWRLLLTRPAEESAALALQLAAAGVHGSCLPLLAIEPLAEDAAMRTLALQLDRYCAVIVVSKPAARLGVELIARHWPQLPALHWFSVGAATAAILEQYGLRVHVPAEGDDSEALLDLAWLNVALQVPNPQVLILRGEGGRELLAERLRERGASVDYLQLYRRRLPEYPPHSLLERIVSERLNGLVVSSGQGFEHLRLLAGEAWPQLAGLPLFVPSLRVAELAQAAGARAIVDCRGASAAALMAALQAHPAAAFQGVTHTR
ncbi:MAG: uroporphyrinogen-III synthase [Pseudomonas sp.]|uniref:uroporphyrinogen-III synthase n=1 Tax=Pseudomonas abieticivorans TaxID=2931382 RepID=UPI0020BF4621|nr:uroporphyrinogen-III synthase [Pseudomonas sp. PIA16]MDE1168596.1 uroporphyrinogen-III synthase [Pseudomonas sp.]